MKLLSVIPLAKSLPYDRLSYFSAKDVNPGSLVSVPLRNRNIKALVIESEELSDMKQLLRNSKYKIRNIHEVHENSIYSKAFLKTSMQLSNYFVLKPGTVIDSLSPSYLLKNIESLNFRHDNVQLDSYQKVLVQQSFDDLVSYLKSLAREQLHLGRSLHIICPTKEIIEKIFPLVSKGIQAQSYFLHSGLSAKKLKQAYSDLSEKNEASILISTALFLDTPLVNKSDLVLFRESHSAYSVSNIQKLDLSVFVKKYAELSQRKIHILDTLLSAETWSEKDSPHTMLMEPFRKKIFSEENLSIYTLNKSKKLILSDAERIKEIEAKKTFSVFHPEVEKIISELIKNKKKIFLYSQQKGLAPSIVCERCGNLARSEESGKPYKLVLKNVSGKKERYYICSASGEQILAFDQCQFCKLFSLKPLGIGTSKIQEELAEKFPDTPSYIIDGQHTKTASACKKVLKSHLEHKESSILIGTKKALPYSHGSDQSIIVSIDSLFSHSGYKVEEEFLSILQEASQSNNAQLILQTRNIIEQQSPIVKHGMYPEYIQSELEIRKSLAFPPYGTLILVDQVCKQEEAQKFHDFFKSEFSAFSKHIFVKPHLKKGYILCSMLLLLKKEDWNSEQQNPNLRMKLQALDKHAKISLNPGFFGI